MTNKHIELVKRWQAGADVSHGELKANADAAEAAYVATARDAAWDDACAEAAAARDAAKAAYVAAYWIKNYEELTNEK
jgi:hypothetical protein